MPKRYEIETVDGSLLIVEARLLAKDGWASTLHTCLATAFGRGAISFEHIEELKQRCGRAWSFKHKQDVVGLLLLRDGPTPYLAIDREGKFAGLGPTDGMTAMEVAAAHFVRSEIDAIANKKAAEEQRLLAALEEPLDPADLEALANIEL